MKKMIAFVVLIIIFIGGLFMFKLFNNKKITDIKSLEYNISDGRMMYGNTYYELKCDSKCILKSNLEGMEDEKYITVDVDKNSVSKIIDILNKYNAYSWNGFNKSDKNVLDGTSYYFRLDTGSDTIDASGYMKYPKNFGVAIKEIIKIFESINIKSFTKVYDYDYYKGLNIDNVIKVEEIDQINKETIEYTDRNNIERVYRIYKDTYTVYDLGKVEDGDVSRTFKFIMNDGKEYEINETWNCIVINNKKYVIHNY